MVKERRIILKPKTITAIILALVLCVGLLPTAAAAADGIRYIDASGNEASQDDVTEISSETVTWTDGWYVVNGTVTIGQRVTVNGNVHIILADGCNLTVNGGIRVTGSNSLTIYAQSTGDSMGSLTAQNVGNYSAGTVSYTHLDVYKRQQQALAKKFRADRLRQRGGMGVGALLDQFQFLNPFLFGGHCADAQTRGDGLGERIEHDDIAAGIKALDRRQCFAAEADVTIGIVLQHHHIVARS